MESWREKVTELGEGLWIIVLAAWVLVLPFVMALGRALAALPKLLWSGWSALDRDGKRRILIGASTIVGLLYAWT